MEEKKAEKNKQLRFESASRALQEGRLPDILDCVDPLQLKVLEFFDKNYLFGQTVFFENLSLKELELAINAELAYAPYMRKKSLGIDQDQVNEFEFGKEGIDLTKE